MGDDADPPACQGVDCEFDTVDAGKHLRALSQRRNEDQTDQEGSDEWCKRTHAGHHREFCPQRNCASREPPQSFHPMYSPSAHQAPPILLRQLHKHRHDIDAEQLPDAPAGGFTLAERRGPVRRRAAAGNE